MIHVDIIGLFYTFTACLHKASHCSTDPAVARRRSKVLQRKDYHGVCCIKWMNEQKKKKTEGETLTPIPPTMLYLNKPPTV